MAQTGYTPISIYYSATATNTPTAGNLVAGELAINTADGKLFYKDSAGVVQVIGTKGGVGSSTTTQVLYNSSGLVVGSANMTFSGTALTLANDASISGLTVGKGTASLRNTVVGQGALNANTTGIGGTYIGYQTGYTNTTGTSNTFIGEQSGYFNTTGTYNTGLGQGSYASNSTSATGSYNTSLGALALYNNTTASYNTATGYQAMYTNTTGDGTAFGAFALKGNTTGIANTAIGGYSNGAGIYAALQTNTTGSYNTAVGNGSLQANTTASNNTAVGYQAGYSASTNGQNTFMGYQAGYSNTSGAYNVSMGSGSLYSAAGSYNVAIGYNAGYNATSASNTFIGQGAGYYVTSGAKNTVLGNYNGNQGSLDIRTASNYIVLSDGDGNPRGIFDNSGDLLVNTTGINASNLSGFVVRAYAGGIYTENGHNTSASSGDSYTIFRYNGTGIGSITQTGTTAVLYNTTSDYRLKTDVTPIQNALATVEALNPVSFTWVDGRKDDGFLAHELQAIIPNCVTGEKDAVNEDSTPKYQQMDNSGVIPFLVKAIQELKAEFDSYKATHP